jgi:hypothetical protein
MIHRTGKIKTTHEGNLDADQEIGVHVCVHLCRDVLTQHSRIYWMQLGYSTSLLHFSASVAHDVVGFILPVCQIREEGGIDALTMILISTGETYAGNRLGRIEL